jgi:hypothetical protein
MKPIEYIRKLQKERPLKKITEDDVPDFVKQEMGEEGVKQYLLETNQNGLASLLWNNLKDKLPNQIKEVFENEKIAIGEINDPSPNAFTKKLGEDGYAVLFNTGLKDFIYRIIRALSARLIFYKDDQELTSFKDICRIISEIFWWYQETINFDVKHAMGPSYPITDQKIKTASRIAVAAESFLVAHEIGHIINEINKEEFADTHNDEYSADYIALGIVLGAYNRQNPALSRSDYLDMIFAYAGAELIFQIFKGLEDLGFEFNDTHPKAALRLEMLRKTSKSVFANEQEWERLLIISRQIDKMFNGVISIINDPTEYQKYYDDEAEAIVEKLKVLLERCSGGVVPNYVKFYQEAPEIFDFGYSFKLTEIVAETTKRFLDTIGVEGLTEEKWKNFQKYKLLIGFTDYMNEPMRSVFRKSLGSTN